MDLGVEFTPAAEQSVEFLKDDVEGLVESGALTQGQAHGLTAKLEAATANLNSGRSRAACNQLKAFINQTEDFVRARKLSPLEGQGLISAARSIQAQIGC